MFSASKVMFSASQALGKSLANRSAFLLLRTQHKCALFLFTRGYCQGPRVFPAFRCTLWSVHKATGRLREGRLDISHTFSTTASVSGEAIGSIQSKHYQLVYTCKVILRRCCFVLPSVAHNMSTFLKFLKNVQLLNRFASTGVLHAINEEDLQTGLP